MSDALPPFPVDDATLLAVEHAMGAGTDYSLSALLDFLAGCTGYDPNAELVQPGRDESDLPEWERGRGDWSDAAIVRDTRIHYSKHDLIRALIAEIRHLRSEAALLGTTTDERTTDV